MITFNNLEALLDQCNSEEEREGLYNMLVMILCLRKHDILREKLSSEANNNN